MFFKINVASKNSQGKLIIYYATDQYVKNVGADQWRSKGKSKTGKAVDLRICYSNSGEREPMEGTCTRLVQNPQRSFVLVTPQGRENYDSEWVYLSMFSASGCQFTANVLFGDEERNDLKKR